MDILRVRREEHKTVELPEEGRGGVIRKEGAEKQLESWGNSKSPRLNEMDEYCKGPEFPLPISGIKNILHTPSHAIEKYKEVKILSN